VPGGHLPVRAEADAAVGAELGVRGAGQAAARAALPGRLARERLGDFALLPGRDNRPVRAGFVNLPLEPVLLTLLAV